MTGAPAMGWAASQVPETGCNLTAGVLGIARELVPGVTLLSDALDLAAAATVGPRAALWVPVDARALVPRTRNPATTSSPLARGWRRRRASNRRDARVRRDPRL